MQVKIIDVIELLGENRIQIKFVGLDDNDVEVTGPLNRKIMPSAYQNIGQIKAELNSIVKDRTVSTKPMDDLKALKGKKYTIPETL